MILNGSNEHGSEECIFVCQCSNIDHLFHVWRWGEDLGFQIMLNPFGGFFRRIVAAVKYIFLVPGYRHMAFEETILKDHEVSQLRDLLSRHLERSK